MKYWLFSLLIIGSILNITASNDDILQTLWTGIIESKPSTVKSSLKKAVKNNIDLTTVRGGHYGDTPLIAALRVYGNILTKQTNNASFIGHNFSKRAFLSSLAGSTLAAISYYKDQQASTALLIWLSSVSLLIPLSGILFQGSLPSQAEVIRLILESGIADLETRNKEGLDALEVFGSYYPFAYELHDELWFKIMSFLIQNSNNASLEYDVIDDITQNLQDMAG